MEPLTSATGRATTMHTSADVLRLLAPHCRPPFFSGDDYANILKIAATMPAALSTSYMFERPVDAPSYPVDFFLWVSDGGRRDVLAGATGDIPESFFAHEPWERIRRFARLWHDGASPLAEVLSVWLEFDVRGVPRGIPIPLIFFTVEPHVSPAPALEILQRHPFESPALASFRRCWEAIPEACRYRTAGVLYSRPTEAIRLILIMTPDEAFRYLERVGWRGRVADLGGRVKKFLRFHGEVALHVDAYPDGVGAQVGMEIYEDEEIMYRRRGGDGARLLDVAVEESLCLPEIRDALVAWSGSDAVELPDGQPARFDRMFHHLKVVSQPDLTLHAKAYTTAECEVVRR
jgi:hypothetical protein